MSTALQPLSNIKREAPAAVLAGLLSDSQGTSIDAAQKLLATAASYGLGLRDYLRLAVDPKQAEKPELYLADANGSFLSGYECALSFLNLPTRDDLDGGITLQMAADTFQTYAGVRAFFPEVVDDMVKWAYRQTAFENLSAIVSQSRTVNGSQVISTVINDAQADYREGTRAIAEGGRIPIHAIKGSQSTVEFFKFGNGYKTSYEFNRRVALDYLTPYALRTQTEIEASKVAVATSILINGDGVNSAAPVVNQSTYNTPVGTNSTNGKISWKHLTAWLVARAKAGAPVDTVVGNWDAYLQWLWLFEVQPNGGTFADADRLAKAGFKPGGVPILQGAVDFALSSTMTNNQLLGISKGFTVEELVESGSLINESKQSIETQEVTYVKTENSGFRLVFGDTRSTFDYSA